MKDNSMWICCVSSRRLTLFGMGGENLPVERKFKSNQPNEMGIKMYD